MTQKTSTTLFYDGTALINHSINAEVLGKSLIALEEAISRTNAIINASDCFVETSVSANFKEGSFGIPVELAFSVDGAIDILKFLGLAGTATLGGSVFEKLKSIGLKKIEEIHIDEQKNTAVVTYDDGSSSEEMSSSIAKVIADSKIRKSIDEFIHQPLSAPGIDSFGFEDSNGKRTKAVDKNQDDIESFRRLKSQVKAESSVNDEDIEVRFLNIQFHSSSGWRLDYNGERLSATMRDESFMGKVRLNEKAFRAGDLFKITLRTESSKDLTGKEVKKYSIIKVKRHRSADRNNG